MADLTFARYTNAILNMLPYWFKIRKGSENSIGARFLNICGLELDDARYVVDYAYKQCYINTADIDMVDFCYKTIIPMPLSVDDIISVYGNGGLHRANTIKEFFGIDQNGVTDNALYSFESYYLDTKRNILYVRQKFNVDALHDSGKISVTFNHYNTSTKAYEEKVVEYNLVPHQVWNFFDELGALVSCPRLPEEPNYQYKERIMDVFIHKSGASLPGLINGIGRELATRRTVYWEDSSIDFELDDPMIVLNSITIDKYPVKPSRVFLTEAGTVLIKSLGEEEDRISHTVSYVWGLEMHQFYNHDDIKLYNELFTVEGKPKTQLKKYIQILNSESPIFWDHFHWNEHYWDQNKSDVSGVGFIPHLYDGSIRGFKQYGYVK